MRLLLSVILWVATLLPVAAKPYPDHTDLFVNDLAGVIAPEAATRLRDQLEQLKSETGIEMTVLTIPTRADYDPTPDIESFATRLFNGWGIGDAARNDGILALVVTVDREMRIELGSGYDQGYDVLAQDMVNRYFLPDFRDGRFSDGIEAGVGETIARIARRHAERLPPEALPAAGGLPAWPFFGGFAVLAGALVFRRRLGDLAARFRRCPQCGARGLHRHGEAVEKATRTTPGRWRDETWCTSCSWRDRHERVIPVRTSSGSGGSFGGGKSSGGGATGKW
mgnify:CR=1 FL=1